MFFHCLYIFLIFFYKTDSSYIDERDDTLFSSDDKLTPVDLNALNAREFVIYKFSCFVRDLLTVHCFHKPVDILLADKLPPNSTLSHNAYRYGLVQYYLIEYMCPRDRFYFKSWNVYILYCLYFFQII